MQLTAARPSAVDAGPKPRLLLVEADPVERTACAAFLTEAGWEVIPVGKSAEAIESWTVMTFPLSVIVTDFHLGGGVSGLEMLGLIRSFGGRMPAVLLGGAVQEQEAGLQGLPDRVTFMRKPCSAALLTALVHQLLADAGSAR